MSYLDFAIPTELQEADIFGARVHFGERVVTASLSERIATIVSRIRFDAFLLEQARSAGADVIQDCRVSNIEDSQTHVTVSNTHHTFRAKYCIVSAGATSTLPTLIRPRLNKSEYAIAVERDLPADDRVVRSFSDGLIDIYFGVVTRGYGWVFPHDGRFNVGLAGIAKSFFQPPRSLDAFVASLPHDVRHGASEARNKVGHPIPEGGHRRRIARGRILLAGDAAGFVDSFYGEGIAYAIRSGILAASAVRTSTTPAAEYTKWCNREIVPPLRYSRVFAVLLHKFPNILLRMFTTNPQVLERYLEVPARKSSYIDFMRWFVPRLPFFLVSR